MRIEKIKVGALESNCYILNIGNDVIVIDPGDEGDKIKSKIKNKNVIAVLITHNHFDHVGALSMFENNLIKDVNTFKESENQIADFKFQVIKTPGHTDDSVTYYFYEDEVMFTGDFLFKDTIGRCDFPNSNNIEMISSLNIIKNYQDNIKIFPGHGDESILGLEKNNFDYYINFLKY